MIKFFIKERREKLGISQKELAKKSGVSSSHIGYIENGDREPTISILCKLALALDCDINELFEFRR